MLRSSNYADFEIKCPYSGTGVMNIGDGTPANQALVDCNAVSVGCTGTSHGTITLNKGGTLATNFIHKVSSPLVSIIEFDGGVLKAKSNDSPARKFVDITGPGTNQLIVKAGGAIVDTGTFKVGIKGELLHDPGLGTTADGGLTVRGAGTLTLSTAATSNFFTGDVWLENSATLALLNVNYITRPTTTIHGFFPAQLLIGQSTTQTFIYDGSFSINQTGMTDPTVELEAPAGYDKTMSGDIGGAGA